MALLFVESHPRRGFKRKADQQVGLCLRHHRLRPGPREQVEMQRLAQLRCDGTQISEPMPLNFCFVGGGIHTETEYLEINSIAPRLYLLTRMIMDISKQK